MVGPVRSILPPASPLHRTPRRLRPRRPGDALRSMAVRRAMARQRSSRVGHAGARHDLSARNRQRRRDVHRRHSHRPWTAGPDAQRRDRLRERRNRDTGDRRRPGVVRHHHDSSPLDRGDCRGARLAERTVAAAADAWRHRGCRRFGCHSPARTSRATEWLRTAGSASRLERRAHRGHRRPHAVLDRSPRGMPGMAVAARTAYRHAEAARASLDWRARAAEGAASSSRADQRGSVGPCHHSAGRVGSIAESNRACSETVRRPAGEIRRTALGTGWSISRLEGGPFRPAGGRPPIGPDRRGAPACVRRTCFRSSHRSLRPRAESGPRLPTWQPCGRG